MIVCPHCRGTRRFVAYRAKRVTCLLGKVHYPRAYYHGCDCGGGVAPTDEEFGFVESVTPAAAELVTQQGALEPFDEAAEKSLPRAAGLRFSSSTVRRITEGVGRDVAERRARGETFGPETLGEPEPWDWERDATGRKVAYFGLDGTGVGQQAADGSAAPGRLPWVGLVFNPTPEGRRRRGRVWEKRCLAGLVSLPEMGRQLRREAAAVGAAEADVLIALTDGGNGLEDCLFDRVFVPLGVECEFVLDFFHAAEHVHDFARTLHPRDETAARERAGDWCHRLKHEGGEALLAALESLDLAAAPPEAVTRHASLCGYLRNNRHRTDYPRYLRNGWQIGSGSVESACKTVVNQRLNGTGMRWSEHGTDELVHVRALYKSEPAAWRGYWSRPPSTATA